MFFIAFIGLSVDVLLQSKRINVEDERISPKKVIDVAKSDLELKKKLIQKFSKVGIIDADKTKTSLSVADMVQETAREMLSDEDLSKVVENEQEELTEKRRGSIK